jgi:putative isomerase
MIARDIFPQFRSKCEGQEDFPQAFTGLYNTLLGLVPRGIRTHEESGLQFYTGYSYGTLYDWDQYFEAILQFYCGLPTSYAVNAISLFIRQQQESGHIVRTVPEFSWSRREHVKPFLCQIAFLCYLVDGHLSWLDENLFTGLSSYLDHWLVHLTPRGSGFPVWDSASHTGMDNHMERAGSSGAAFCEGVDLASYLVRETLAMSLLAHILGRDDDAERFRVESEALKARMLQQMWDDSESVFFDIDARTGSRIRVKYVGAFAALWSRVAEPEQARAMVERQLLSEEQFWTPFPIPALARSEPGYAEGFLAGDTQGCCSWRAHTWVPTNYYVVHGLANYGWEQAAHDLANRTFEMFFYYPFQEYYTSENGIGTGLRPFWGWSALALFLPLEAALGADPTELAIGNDSIAKVREAAREIAR